MGIEVALAGASLAATAAGGLMQAQGAKQTASCQRSDGDVSGRCGS
jgi:hypothetical protein